MSINATSPVTSREAGYDLAFGAATLYAKKALTNGAGVANQVPVVEDLRELDDAIRNDLTAYQSATEAALEALRRGVPKSYAVAGISATVAGIAAAAVPTYEAPIPDFADYILVTDPLDGGIYTRAGAIVHRNVADFPAGAQVYVDQTNRVYRVQDQPTADEDGLTIGEINFVPFSDFNPQLGVGAIVTTGSEIELATGEEFSQAGRTLRFSQATSDQLTNLRTDIDAASAINTTQNNRIGDTESAIASQAQSITTLNGQVSTINSTALPALQAGIDARIAKDATQDADVAALQGVTTTHGQQLGSLVTITNQQAGQIATVTAAEAALEAEIDALTDVVASKDTAALRDAAIASSAETIKALFPVFALKAGDSQIARVFNSGANETTFTISGLTSYCTINGVFDAARRRVPISDDYVATDGTSASFVVTGDVPFNDAWLVFLSTHKPANFVTGSNSGGGSNTNDTAPLVPGSDITFSNGARFVVNNDGTYEMFRADGVQLWSDTVTWNSAKYKINWGIVFADTDGTYSKKVLSSDFFENDQDITQAQYNAF